MMGEQTLMALKAAGVDTDGAVARFMGNTALYERFLRKFPADPSYGQAVVAMETGELEAVLTAVHTLKGVAGNLGMTRLFDACTHMLEYIRGDRPEQARQCWPDLQQAYEDVLKVLTVEGLA
ncbi:Hpt domain-containing protein [Flavonifractor hominis]|uniref:Hpt domain-containing protein n=1 Tax=Flavonifractor hominis TaxID=3133178 RepID=A0ABV1EMJ9_9FIRM